MKNFAPFLKMHAGRDNKLLAWPNSGSIPLASMMTSVLDSFITSPFWCDRA